MPDNAPEVPKRRRRGSVCLECGADLEAPYCRWCGLKAGAVARPLDELAQDLLNDFFVFDHKVWRTLRDLFKEPATVPDRFLEGRRHHYIGPGRTLLFSTVLLVAVSGGFALEGGLVERLSAVAAGLPEEQKKWLPWMYVLFVVPVFSVATAFVMRHRMFVEHLVYGVYLWSAIWLLVGLDSLLAWLGTLLLPSWSNLVMPWISAAISLGALVYVVVSFRDFYRLGSILGAALVLPFVVALGGLLMFALSPLVLLVGIAWMLIQPAVGLLAVLLLVILLAVIRMIRRVARTRAEASLAEES